MSKKFIRNFSFDRCGYHLLSPVVEYGFELGIKEGLGKSASDYLSEHFFVMEGVDLKGYYFIEDELKHIIADTTNLVLTKPQKIIELHTETLELNQEYFDFAHKVSGTDLAKQADAHLGLIYRNMRTWQEKAHATSLTTTWFIDSHKETFSKLLQKKVSEYTSKTNSDLNPAEVFTKLTTSHQNSLTMEEERETLELLAKISKNDQAAKILRNISDFNTIPENLPNKIQKLIQNHFEKWRWLSFDYMGPAYNLDYFLQVWSGLLKENVDFKEELYKLKTRPEKIARERNQIFKDLNISKQDQDIFNIAAEITFLKGYRKEVSFYGFYIIDKIFREMAKRLQISLSQMYLMSYKEIEAQFIDKQPLDMDEINKRQGYTIGRVAEKKVEYLYGQEAKDYFASKDIEVEPEKTNGPLLGTCACSGKAKGKVKIINQPKYMSKMEEGDVMVAVRTFPSLVPAMKKATAIITEEGGITCHAAIVSREMNTPCVTGIKNITKILKDKDKVEVDADVGLVKKL